MKDYNSEWVRIKCGPFKVVTFVHVYTIWIICNAPPWNMDRDFWSVRWWPISSCYNRARHCKLDISCYRKTILYIARNQAHWNMARELRSMTEWKLVPVYNKYIYIYIYSIFIIWVLKYIPAKSLMSVHSIFLQVYPAMCWECLGIPVKNNDMDFFIYSNTINDLSVSVEIGIKADSIVTGSG